MPPSREWDIVTPADLGEPDTGDAVSVREDGHGLFPNLLVERFAGEASEMVFHRGIIPLDGGERKILANSVIAPAKLQQTLASMPAFSSTG